MAADADVLIYQACQEVGSNGGNCGNHIQNIRHLKKIYPSWSDLDRPEYPLVWHIFVLQLLTSKVNIWMCLNEVRCCIITLLEVASLHCLASLSYCHYCPHHPECNYCRSGW